MSGYAWMFIDRNGNPVAPSLLAKTVKESPDGSLHLGVVRPSAIADGVRGACRIAVDRGSEGKQYYQSEWFTFKAPVEAGGTSPEEPGVVPEGDGKLLLRALIYLIRRLRFTFLRLFCFRLWFQVEDQLRLKCHLPEQRRSHRDGASTPPA